MASEHELLLGLGAHSPYVHQLFFHLLKDRQQLLREAESKLKLASLCQNCGVTGYEELLVYCRKCRVSAQHLYCLERLPKSCEKVRWFCEECKLSVESRSKDDVRGNEVQHSYSDSITRPQDNEQILACDGITVSVSEHENVLSRNWQSKPPEKESSPCTSTEQSDGRKSKRRRRLILPEEDLLEKELNSACRDQEVTNATVPQSESIMTLPPIATNLPSDEVRVSSQVGASNPSVSRPMECRKDFDEQATIHVAQPIVDHVWRGGISFGGEIFGPFLAHVSNLACKRVFDAAQSLPPLLLMEKLTRDSCWPNSFKSTSPTADKIGLYLFLENTKASSLLDSLLDEVIQKDLAFLLALDEAEMLLFPSTLLPKDHHRFLGKYYFWGVFRKRQASVAAPAKCNSEPSEVRVDNQKMELSNVSIRNKESESRDEESSDVSQNCSPVISPFSLPQRPQSIDLGEELWRRKSAGLSKQAGPYKMAEAFSKEPYELEEGEICDEYAGREEGELLKDDEDGNCLQLFPLAVEDMGIISQVGGGNELNLELGLSRQSVRSGQSVRRGDRQHRVSRSRF